VLKTPTNLSEELPSKTEQTLKILIYSMNFWPEQTGIGKYSGEMTEWLAEQGHDVRVICSAPYYPQWKIQQGYSGWSYHREIWNGAKVYRCPAWIPRRPRAISRILYLLIFALTSLPVAFRMVFWRPDVVFVVEPPLSCVPSALVTARMSGALAWIHIQDFEVDAALDLGLVKIPGLKTILTGIERWLLRRFDVRSTISPKMKERLDDKTGPSRRNSLFVNWVDLTTIFPLDHSSSFRAELGIQDHQHVALYSGNMGKKQGLEVVVEAAKILHHRDDICFVMCGAGAAYKDLRSLANGLQNIIWIPLQPIERLNDLLNLADVHLLPQKSDAADLVMPSKLTGMLASGRPVLATALEGTQVYDLVQRVGRSIPPGNPHLLADALVAMMSDSEQRLLLGKEARRIAERELGRDAVLGGFSEQLQQFISNR